MQNKKSLFHKITAVGVALLLTCVAAFAVITPLTVVTLKQNNYAVVAGDLNLTPAAMDAVNGNSFTATGKEVLLFVNTDTVTHTVTVTSTADPLGRLDTSLTTYTVPVAVGGLSGLAAIEMTNLNGWIQSGQTVNMTTSSALVKISVLRHQ
jgi:hypothetical protein